MSPPGLPTVCSWCGLPLKDFEAWVMDIEPRPDGSVIVRRMHDPDCYRDWQERTPTVPSGTVVAPKSDAACCTECGRPYPSSRDMCVICAFPLPADDRLPFGPGRCAHAACVMQRQKEEMDHARR